MTVGRVLHRYGSLPAYLALALVAGLVPLIVHNPYYLSIWILVAIYGIMAIALSLLMGYTGQVSLGHAAFYGLGAYASAIGTTRYHINPWLCMLLGVAITALVAYLVGRPTLRLHGHYLAMATLGIGIIVQIFFREGGTFTGGFSGLAGIPQLRIAGLAFDTDRKCGRLCSSRSSCQPISSIRGWAGRCGRFTTARWQHGHAALTCPI